MTRLPLLDEVRNCRLCEHELPHVPRPLVQGSASSPILIIGQAPGRVAHETAIPWRDRSGDRLRDWMDLTVEQFYDPQLVALLPMGLCFPGSGPKGDLPPKPRCARQWHQPLLDAFTNVRLRLIIGKYAFERYLAGSFDSISHAVAGYRQLSPGCLALPHPSPRNNHWLAKNPWFESQVLPVLQQQVRALIPTPSK